MITTKRDNNCVKILIGTDLPHDCEGKIETTIPFSWEQTHPYQAALLQKYIDERLRDWMRCIRRESYEAGYRDGKGKKRKETWFSSLL